MIRHSGIVTDLLCYFGGSTRTHTYGGRCLEIYAGGCIKTIERHILVYVIGCDQLRINEANVSCNTIQKENNRRNRASQKRKQRKVVLSFSIAQCSLSVPPSSPCLSSLTRADHVFRLEKENRKKKRKALFSITRREREDEVAIAIRIGNAFNHRWLSRGLRQWSEDQVKSFSVECCNFLTSTLMKRKYEPN